MERLNKEQQKCLRALIKAQKKGLSAQEAVDALLDTKTASMGEPNMFGAREREALPGFEQLYDVLGSLIDAGMIDGSRVAPDRIICRNLTTAGRCYFSEVRRTLLRELVPSLISGLFAIVGAAVGFLLGKLR